LGCLAALLAMSWSAPLQAAPAEGEAAPDKLAVEEAALEGTAPAAAEQQPVQDTEVTRQGDAPATQEDSAASGAIEPGDSTIPAARPTEGPALDEAALGPDPSGPPSVEAPAIAGPVPHPREVPEPRMPTDYGPEPLATSAAHATRVDLPLRVEKARGWRDGGIAGLSVGTVLVGAAIAVAATDPDDPKAGNSGFESARNRAAVTIAIPGGLVALGGAAMLTYGLVKERRLRAGASIDRRGAALRLNYRF
jgi:hypothetical protein